VRAKCKYGAGCPAVQQAAEEDIHGMTHYEQGNKNSQRLVANHAQWGDTFQLAMIY
jgi:hypothetical protein